VALFARAQTSLLNHDYARAEAEFQQVLRLVANSAPALVNLGVVYLRTGKYDRAIELFRKTQILSPEIPFMCSPVSLS